MENGKIMGLIGSALLFLGAFAPIVSIPFAGNQNYFQNGRGDGVVIVILAAISAVLALTGRLRGLWITGLASLAVVIFTFINFEVRISEMKSKMSTELADNPFRGLADLAVGSVQLQWGWAILVVGALLLLGAAASRPKAAT